MFMCLAYTILFDNFFFSLKTRPELRDDVKKLIASKQLEIVTGGWVMTDEASVHYYSMIDQLVEGHQWLKHHLGITPKTSWSVDPFGYSATMPYILKRSGLNGKSFLTVPFMYLVKCKLSIQLWIILYGFAKSIVCQFWTAKLGHVQAKLGERYVFNLRMYWFGVKLISQSSPTPTLAARLRNSSKRNSSNPSCHRSRIRVTGRRISYSEPDFCD